MKQGNRGITDSFWYKSKQESERVFEFLVGINHKLNNVRGRIHDLQQLPCNRELFSEVHHEEGRQCVMLREMGGFAYWISS